MTPKDEFDDAEGFQSAFGKIAEAMEQSRTEVRKRGPLLGVATLAVALFVLFAVFWSTYPRGDRYEAGAGPVPVIRADATPYKVSPDNPGGMDIPYRDSTVFETLRNASNDDNAAPAENRVESLLPPPEEPIDRAQMFAGLKTEPLDTPVDESKDFGPVATAGTQTAEASAPEGGSAAVIPERKPAELAAAPTRAEEKEAVKAEPAAGDATAKVEARPQSSGTHYIQLGSVKDRAGAEAEWKRLQKQFPAELGNLTMRVQEAKLDKGTFYRIQGGAVAQADAKAICAALAAKRSGGCLVVAR